ncbi:MAG: hypothetical protein FRX49_03618 [Trebouxia sp. A1-2]|nr:MAG: hypothetical protein FRX49_03618 [Trebouxia sp. A1-2]
MGSAENRLDLCWTPPDDAACVSHSSSSNERLLSVTPLRGASQLEDVPPAHQQLSVREAYAGRTVLLTGVTGFVGSLVLEQLLRTCPEIARVYVVVRQKHGISGRARFHKMLHTNPLFHLLRDTLLLPCFAGSAGHDALLFEDASSDDGNRESIGCKTPQIEAIAGNMTLPDYGIAQADLLRLQQQTEIVIHAAASISFDDHIHDAITHNYMATKYIADMASRMPNLKAFVHVSTAYVNGNQSKGSVISEAMLPLTDQSNAHVSHSALVAHLQALPKPKAAEQAQGYMQQWRFPNTYCFSKHLAESLMTEYHTRAFPVAIVRPSIIGAVAGSPLPGYVGNTAGSTGAALAIATGIAAWTCHQPSSTFDLVPGDIVSSTILAAAAVTAQGCSRNRHPLIVHACTSSQNPLTTGQFFQQIQAYFSTHPPPFRVILGPYPKYQGLNIVSNSSHLRAVRYILAEAKFVVLCGALRAAGQEHLAKKLFSGWKAWQKYNRPALDFDLCFKTDNLRWLRQSLPVGEQSMFRLSWESADWRRYMQTYMAGIQHRIFKQPTFADAAQHDFMPWPLQPTLSAAWPQPVVKS